MSPKNTHKKAVSKPVAFQNKGYMIPILFSLAVIPLIVLAKQAPTHLQDYPWYPNHATTLDFFLYYKHIFIIITGIVSLVILCITFVKQKKEFRRNKVFYFLLAYAILCIFSTINSKYKINAVAGIPDQFESIFVLLAYCVICYYSYQYLRTEVHIRYLLRAFQISMGWLCILGIFQISGHDLISSDLGLKITTIPLGGSVRATLNFGNHIFLTLFNPDYVGVYCILVLPLLIMLILHTKNRKEQIIYAILTAGMLLCLFGSHSSAGIMTLGFAIFFLLILHHSFLWKHKKITLPVFAIAAICAIVFFVKFDFADRIYAKFFNASTSKLEQIETKDDCIMIQYQGQVLNIAYSTNESNEVSLQFTDDQGLVVNSVFDSTAYTLQDERYPQFIITPQIIQGIGVFYVNIEGIDWLFTNQYPGESSYYYINSSGALVKLSTHAKTCLPASFDTFASGRGFIWSTSLPLAKDHILLGAGPDCFVFEYPNSDYVSMGTHGFSGQLMTKPHSLYLQIAIQTGAVSLVVFLLFYLIYWVNALRIYLRHSLDTLQMQLGAAILVSTTCYMIVGITNDSTITVAPIFWALLGMGMALNHMNRTVKE